jgi:hypothetical protein
MKRADLVSRLVLALALGGAAGPAAGSALLQALRNGEGGVSGLDGARDVAVSPDGAHVFVASATDDALAVFSRDAASGLLEPFDVLREGGDGVTGLDGANQVAVSPDGLSVYVSSPVSEAIAVFSRDAATGALAFVEAEPGLAAGYLEVSPDGQKVLLAGGELAIFDRDPADGSLAFDRTLVWFGVGHGFAYSPDGRHAYASQGLPVQGGGGSVLSIATRNEEGDYALGNHGGGIAFPCVSADGLFAYGALSELYADPDLCWWSRDTESGALALVDCRAAPGPLFRSVPSPDGEFLYLSNGAALFRYARDGATGALTAGERIAIVRSLAGMTVTPDSRHVLGASEIDEESNLLVFAPEPSVEGALAACAIVAVLARIRARRAFSSA